MAQDQGFLSKLKTPPSPKVTQAPVRTVVPRPAPPPVDKLPEATPGIQALASAVASDGSPEAPAAEQSPAPSGEGTAAPLPDASNLADLASELRADVELQWRLLGLLYHERKKKPDSGAISIILLEHALGQEREGLSFTIFYLKSKRYIQPDDKSRVMITVEGIDYLKRLGGATSRPADL